MLICASFCFVLLVANSVIPVSLLTTSFGQQFEPSMIQMPLGLSTELGLGQNEDNTALQDNMFEGSSDSSAEIVGEKEIKQENIAFERQDIDSQSGNVKNLAQG